MLFQTEDTIQSRHRWYLRKYRCLTLVRATKAYRLTEGAMLCRVIWRISAKGAQYVSDGEAWYNSHWPTYCGENYAQSDACKWYSLPSMATFWVKYQWRALFRLKILLKPIQHSVIALLTVVCQDQTNRPWLPPEYVLTYLMYKNFRRIDLDEL